MHLTLLGEYNLNQYEIILYTYDNWSFAHLNYLFFLFHYNWLYHMYFARKGLYSQTYGFSSSHVWMWELDHKQGWALNKWCFWTVVLEKTLKSPLDCTEIKPVNPKGNQSWIFIGRADADAEAPILWPPDATSRLIWKDPDAGKDWRQEEKGTTEDEIVGWHHRLNDMSLSKLQEMVKNREAWHAAVHVVTKSRTWLSNWTTTYHIVLVSCVQYKDLTFVYIVKWSQW